jgi:hypothetical protein
MLAIRSLPLLSMFAAVAAMELTKETWDDSTSVGSGDIVAHERAVTPGFVVFHLP